MNNRRKALDCRILTLERYDEKFAFMAGYCWHVDFVFSNFNQQAPTKQLTYSEFVNSVSSGDVKRVRIDGLTISGERANGEKFDTIRPPIPIPN